MTTNPDHPAGGAGAVKVKPLDFSTCLKHAFLSGVVAAREIAGHDECNGPALWVKYVPYEPGAYSRILSALSPTPPVPDLVSRAEVLSVLRRLGDQDADLALYGAEDNARAREYGEAAMTRACCAVAVMPSLAGVSEVELREAVCAAVGLGLDAEDTADEVILRVFGERS